MGEIKLFVTIRDKSAGCATIGPGSPPFAKAEHRERLGGRLLVGRLSVSGLAVLAWAGFATAVIPPIALPMRVRLVGYAGSDPAIRRRRSDPANIATRYSRASIPTPASPAPATTITWSFRPSPGFPGIPVFHSRDLVNWTQIGNAIDRRTARFRRLGVSRGVFAPAIEHHDGTFYILNTCVDCGGNFLVTARDPAGPGPIRSGSDIEGGIDPSLFFDDDGKAWIVNNGPPAGHRSMTAIARSGSRQFDLRTCEIGPRTMIVNGGVDLARSRSGSRDRTSSRRTAGIT